MTETGRRRAGFPVGLVGAATFLAGVIVLLLLFRSEDGDIAGPAPVEFDVEAFEARIEERLEPIALRPAGAFRVRVSGVSWPDGTGRPFMTAPAAVFVVALPGPGQGLHVTSGVITEPTIRLVRSPGGQWNYERALAPLLNGGDRETRGRGGGAAFSMANIVVRGGDLTVELPDTRFAARSVELRLTTARLSGPGVDAPTFAIASAAATLELPDTAGGTITRAVSLEDARLRLLDGALAFEVDRGTFGSSTFADASGVWDPALGGLGLDADLRAESFRLADLPWLRAEVPAEASGSFRVRIQPAGPDRTSVALSGLTLTAPGSSATGSLTAIFGGGTFSLEAIDMRVDPLAVSLVEAFTGPLPYTGDLRGTLRGTGGDIAFDLTARLATSLASSPFETQLAGSVSFTPTGISLERVTATLDRVPLSALEAIAPGLPLGGAVSGTVSLSGMPSAGPMRVDVRLEAGGGIVTVAGIVDLSGAVPAYDVAGRLAGVELRAVFEPAMPPAQLHATFDLEGSGTELATADAAIRLDGTFTGWRSEPGDTVALQATLRGGRLDVSAGRLELGPVSLAAEGDWALAGDGGGAIRYQLAVSSLEPLAPYLPPDAVGRARFARGSLHAEGAISGTLDAPTLGGTIEARDFRYGEWAAERLEGEYTADLARVGFPTIEARVTGAEIHTPSGDFRNLRLDVDFSRPTFAVALRADQLGGGVVELEAAGRIEEEGGREIRLSVVELDLEDQRWRLPSPARIAWTAGDAVRIEDLRLEQTDGGGLLRLDGIVAPFDQANLAVEVRSLPVGELLDVIGMDLDIAGDLSVDGDIRGPAESPVIALTVALGQGTIRDVAVRNITAELRYADEELTIDGTGVLGDSAYVELTGALPARMSLGLPPSLELIEGREIALHLVTDDFPLGTLDPGIRSVQDVEGLLRADMRIGGTTAEPRLTGDMQLVDGAVTIPVLDKRYTEIDGLATLSGREVRVQRMVAHSGGTASVTGVITFEELTNPTFDLAASLDDFQPQGADNADDAAASGTLRLTGSLGAPVVSGRVVMDNGTVSMVPFTSRTAIGDRLVGVAESFAPIATGELDIPGVGEPAIRVEGLEFVAGNDLWFATEEARAQLRGTLDLQTLGNDMTIQGTLVGEQGTFDLRVGPVRRRFSIVAANIRFLGDPDPNPALDITASRRVPTLEGSNLEVRVRVTGTANNPQLSLGSAEGVAVAQSELLSLLLFGRQFYTAGDALGSGQDLVGQIGDIGTIAGAYDILSAELGESDLLEELDQFQIQQRGAGLFDFQDLWLIAGEQVSLGREDVLLTFETPLQQQNELWILGAEWRIDRQWTLELSFEPERYLGAVGAGRLPVSIGELEIDRQFLFVIRRRWTY